MSNEQIFVIGDIHGCAEELHLLLDKLPLTSNSQIVFVGDYIDRGENSKEVISTIINLQNYYSVATLMGNHEAMFLDFLNNPASMEAAAFIYNGGTATLASYADAQGKYVIPDDHLEFFKKLILFSQTEKFFFVHAGVPDVPLEKMDPAKHKNDLLWIRWPFFKSSFEWKKIIVHGHTPNSKVEITPKRINVDTGCVYENCLSAIELNSQEIFTVKKQSKTPHTYLRDLSSQRKATRFQGKVPVTILVHGQPLNFQTINYSEFGLLVSCLTYPSQQVLKEGDNVSGEIQILSDSQFQWNGRVVRVQIQNNQYQYAIQLNRS